MKAIAPASTPVLVELVDGQPTTTSLDVSAHFGKRHADVIRAISKLDCSAEFTERNFALSEYTDSTGRKLTQYRLTRDGFTFLCMGFTGKEAAKWKEAYINAFNEMERALSGAGANPGAAAGPSEPAEPIHLTYNDRPFRIVPEGAALWFVAADVAHALDMRDAYRITRHLRSEHKALRQIGNKRLSLIDRQGLELALHHASPARSEPLRLWLEAALEQFVGAAPRALLGGLSGEQQGALKALVAARIETLPEAQRGKAATRCWSALKAKFGCGYKEIEPEQFTEAVSLVARMVLEGELLEPEAPKVLGRLAIDFPIEDWKAKNPHQFRHDNPNSSELTITTGDVLMSEYSPGEALLGQLAEAGYRVDGPLYELRSLRSLARRLDMTMRFMAGHVRQAADHFDHDHRRIEHFKGAKTPR